MPDSRVILGLDTTSEWGSLALRRGHETALETPLHAPEGFGQVIFQAIEKILEQTNTRLDEIDCFAAARGPGSFTGVRVGLAAIKGLAEAMGRRAAGISNLRALSLFGREALRAVVLDARRGEVYGAVYDENARVVVPETVGPWEAWRETIPAEAEFIGLADGPLEKAGVSFTAADRWLAAAVGRCAEMDGDAGWLDPVALDANYVRRSDAELFWREREG